MKKMVVFLSLAFSALALGGASAGTGKATTLMTKDLPDWPGKEGMVEIVDFAPGEVSQPHRHNADLFVYVLEGSVVTRVVVPRRFTPARFFMNPRRISTP
jgi:quercetin dioxygenase-like cupin family protein